jgi:uncharacterized membrane protein YqhA
MENAEGICIMERLLLSARYLIVLAVLTSLVGAVAILIYGLIITLHIIGTLFLEEAFTIEASKELALGFIEVLDLLFLGVVMYITALGLYRLFINQTFHLPHWLKIEEFEELKVILVGVVIVLLAVNFTGQVVDWHGTGEILTLGIAISMVIASIGLILYVRNYRLSHALPEETHTPHQLDP